MYKINISDYEYTMPENETDCYNMSCRECAMYPTTGIKYYECVDRKFMDE